MASVEERVKQIIVEQLGVDEGEVTPTASFVDDLGADSLDTVELVMAFEEAFGIEIPDEDAEKIATVKDAIEYIEKHAKAGSKFAGSSHPEQEKFSLNRRVVVTGVGLVCGCGIGTEEVWRNLLAGKSGIGPVTHFDVRAFDCRIAGEVKNFDPLNWVEKKELKKMARFIQLALAASDFAMRMAGLEITPELADCHRRLHRLRHRRVRRNRARTLQILCTAAPARFLRFSFPRPSSISPRATSRSATAPKDPIRPRPPLARPALTPSATLSKSSSAATRK